MIKFRIVVVVCGLRFAARFGGRHLPLVVGLLIVVFAGLELSPAFSALAVPSR